MPILASEALLHENKKNPVKNVTLSGNRTSDSKSNTLLSGLIWHVLLIGSLNFFSCTSWFLNLDDSVRINRAWLYKKPKVSVLQANVNLVQKGECWTWNQKLWEARVLFPLGVTFLTGFFWFHVAKPLMPVLDAEKGCKKSFGSCGKHVLIDNHSRLFGRFQSIAMQYWCKTMYKPILTINLHYIICWRMWTIWNF